MPRLPRVECRGCRAAFMPLVLCRGRDMPRLNLCINVTPAACRPRLPCGIVQDTKRGRHVTQSVTQTGESRRPECHADSQPRQRSQSRRVKEHTEDQSKGTRKDTTSRSLVGAGSSERSSYDAGTLYELCANFVANGRKVLCCELGCELCCELCANSVVDWRKINLNRYL